MIQLPVLVDQSDRGAVWVRTEMSSGCDRCAKGNGCGALFWMRVMPQRRLRISAGFPVNSGDKLTLEINERAFLLLVMFTYLLPLTVILFAAGVGQWLWGEAGALALVALVIVGWGICVRLGWTARFFSAVVSSSGLLLQPGKVGACISDATTL